MIDPNDRTNGWANALAPRAPEPALEGEITVDCLVIGAGYAGLAAARRYADLAPNARVLLVDAARVGEGASARNSGFVIDLPHNVGADLSDLTAQRRALRLARAATEDLRQLVRRHQIDCQWSEQGQIMAARSPAGAAALGTFRAGLDALGEAYTPMDGGAVGQRTGARGYREGVHTPGTVLIQPAALVRGLAGTLPPNVTLHEATPVTALHPGIPVRAETPGGTIRARHVIVAVNGAVARLGLLRGRVFQLQLYCSMTRPLSEDEHAQMGAEAHQDADWGIVPALAFGGPTIRYTRDRRLTMRAQFTGRVSGRAAPRDYARARALHARQIAARFPHLPPDVITDTWMGQIALSKNFAPGFMQVSENVFTAVCQNGVGVTKGTLAGRLAAERALSQDSDLLADMIALGTPAALPPRPFLDLGIKARLAQWTWSQRAET
ncbi:MAG: FAD-binding oxidoreductase [Pseudomonadota bacterium]